MDHLHMNLGILFRRFTLTLAQLTYLHSRSKTSIDLGGMSGGAPWSPYAMLAGTVSRLLPPT